MISIVFSWRSQVIRFEISEQELEAINKERFYHPDPIMMKRCETVLLRVKGFSTQQIHEITGRSPNSIRNCLFCFSSLRTKARRTQRGYFIFVYRLRSLNRFL
jgi:hypothetical protein